MCACACVYVCVRVRACVCVRVIKRGLGSTTIKKAASFFFLVPLNSTARCVHPYHAVPVLRPCPYGCGVRVDANAAALEVRKEAKEAAKAQREWGVTSLILDSGGVYTSMQTNGGTSYVQISKQNRLDRHLCVL